MLTDAALKHLKPKDKNYKVTDRDGMYVLVRPSGTLTFQLDYRMNGRRETITFGKYGPAAETYTHFTSPIRRYPDLLVHRAIRHVLSGKRPEAFRYGHDDMVALGEHCSMTERRADEATRDAVDWLKCEYMLDKVGAEFQGIVTGVTGFGLFIELNDIYIEGLVHVTSLHNDYYHFDPAHHRLVGERTHRIYRLADKLEVQVLRVDLDERKIDFGLAGEPGQEKKAAGRSKGKSKSKAETAAATSQQPTQPAAGEAKKKKRRRRGKRRTPAAE